MAVNHNEMRTVIVVLLCVAAIVLIYLGILNKVEMALINPIILSSVSDKFAHLFKIGGSGTGTTDHNNNMTELELRLSKAANQNKTVIITSLNAAWAQNNGMMDLFMQSFRAGNETEKLLKHLLIVAVDNKALQRCRQIHDHCYLMKTEGIDYSAEEVFMTKDYLKMMWRRLRFFGQVLEAGYNYVFTDADILWFRDPFTKFSSTADMNIASDSYNGNPHDLNNHPNGGYMYVRSNERTISFFKFWYESKSTYPGRNEQEVLNYIKFQQITQRGIELVFLDTEYFRGYCQGSQDLSNVYTMHANCCKGLEAKLNDLRNTLSDWEKYIMKKPPGSIDLKKVHWTPPSACRHSWGH